MPRDPWTGERYTPQIPAHYTLKVINKKRNLEISPRDIPERLRGAEQGPLP